MIVTKTPVSNLMSILWNVFGSIINSSVFIFLSCVLSTAGALLLLIALDVSLVVVAVSALKKDDGLLGMYVFDVLMSFMIAGTVASLFIEIRSWARKKGFFSRSRVVFYAGYLFFSFIIIVGESFEDPAFASDMVIWEIEKAFYFLDWSKHVDLFSMVQNYFLIFFLLFLFFWMIKLEKPLNAFLIKILGLVWVYLFSGILFSAAWVVLYLSDNSALTEEFKVPFDAVYFSFATMTTLGYGDISPVTYFARFIAVAQSVFGVFFSSLLVGMAVGYTMTVVGVRKN